MTAPLAVMASRRPVWRQSASKLLANSPFTLCAMGAGPASLTGLQAAERSELYVPANA